MCYLFHENRFDVTRLSLVSRIDHQAFSFPTAYGLRIAVIFVTGCLSLWSELLITYAALKKKKEKK